MSVKIGKLMLTKYRYNVSDNFKDSGSEPIAYHPVILEQFFKEFFGKCKIQVFNSENNYMINYTYNKGKKYE